MRESINRRSSTQTGIALPKLLIALVAVLVVVGAGLGGAWYFMHDAKAAKSDAKAMKKQPPPDPTFVKIDPLTVNLQDDSGRVLYVGISLQVANQQTEDKIKAYLPQVRNRILLALSDENADTLTTSQGKKALAASLRKTIRQPYTDHAKPLAVQSVLFTDFIVQ